MIKNQKLQCIDKYLNTGFVPIIVNYKNDEYNGRIIYKKSPLERGWNKITKETAKQRCEQFLNFDENYNIGILTGKPSNIIVIDLDQGNDGEKSGIEIIEELENENNSKIKTLTCSTPSGGRHYYFRYERKYDNLKGTTKVGGFPIDIRTTGNQVIAPPSKYENGEYTWMNYPENNMINDMPDYLYDWIMKHVVLMSKKYQINPITQISYHETNDYTPETRIYGIDDLQIKDIKYMLDKLPLSYAEDYELWIVIGFCLKSIISEETYDFYPLFVEFSKRSNKFDDQKCYDTWTNKIKHKDDGKTLRTLIQLFHYTNPKDNRKIDIPYTIKYEPIQQFRNTNKFKTVKISEKYVNTNHIDEMLKHKVIMLKSPTNTGKTTLFKHYLTELNKYDPTHKILSTVSRVCMVQKQIHDFKTIGFDMKSYKNKTFNSLKMICQVDSLITLDSYLYKDCVLFLDEINSICSYFTSETLKSKRCKVFDQFCLLIKNAKYIFACDADISDMSLQFIYTLRKQNYHDIVNKDMVFFWNDIKNIKNKTAVIYDDVNTLKSEIFDINFKNNKPFIVACDSKTEIDKLVEESKKYCFTNQLLERPKDILVYSAEDGDSNDFADLNNKWKNKFVFFTPKIIYGLDFNSIPTDVYGLFFNRSINAAQMAQQLIRCRNPDNVKIYIKNSRRRIRFHNINEIPNTLDDKIKLVEELLGQRAPHFNRTFIDLYIMIIYYDGILRSRPKYHLLDLLKQKGFTISYNKVETQVNDGNILDIKNRLKTTQDADINEIMNFIKNSNKKINIRQKNKYEKIIRRCKILDKQLKDLYDDEQLLDIVISDTRFKKYITFKKASLSEDEFNKLYLLYDEYDELMDKTDFPKISLMYKLEKILNIEKFQIKDINILETHQNVANLNSNDFTTLDIIQKTFKFNLINVKTKLTIKRNKQAPKKITIYTLYQILIRVYKYLFGEDFVKGKQKVFKINNKCIKVIDYSINY